MYTHVSNFASVDSMLDGVPLVSVSSASVQRTIQKVFRFGHSRLDRINPIHYGVEICPVSSIDETQSRIAYILCYFMERSAQQVVHFVSYPT